MRMKLLLLALAAFAASFTGAASAQRQRPVLADPFFDCAQPKTDVQKVVCRNHLLLNFDRDLDAAHKSLLARLPEPQQQRLIDEQREWLKQREAKCAGMVGAKSTIRQGTQFTEATAACIELMYHDRSTVLFEWSEKAACPNPATAVQDRCKEIEDRDLPQPARAVFEKLGCTGGAGGGTAVDLNGDGSPEYAVCCEEPPHGACAAVLLGKKGAEWKSLLPDSETLLGYGTDCAGLIILENRHEGYHDLCQPSGQYPQWRVVNGTYQPVKPAAPK